MSNREEEEEEEKGKEKRIYTHMTYTHRDR
jgi:hypothetical protein